MNDIHSPANLKPEDYYVVDYLDNRRPQYYGGPVDAYKAAVEQWESDIAHYFPKWRRADLHPDHDIHHCHHCGNGTVRYICVVEHAPTKALLVFGSECVCKLDFANQNELKLATIKARAEQGHARLKVWKARNEFLTTCPELRAIVESKQIENLVHAKNDFARDILRKFDFYGSISESQLAYLVKSLQQDINRAERLDTDAEEKVRLIAAGVLAPEGRVAVKGTVLHTRAQESEFGIQYKWLVKIESGAKVWSTIPSSVPTRDGIKELVGKQVEFTATFERSKDDQLFAFGKRPSKASLL